MPIAAVSSPPVRFYFEGLADPTFLAEQGIYYWYCTEHYSLFAERSATGQPRVYVIDRFEGLFLLDASQLTRVVEGAELTPARLEQLVTKWLPQVAQLAQVGQCVLHGQESGAPVTHPDLSVAATAAAKAVRASKDVTWCFTTFVDLAFLGDEPNCTLQYTSAGVRVQLRDPTDSFGEDKQHLDRLHALGLVRVQWQPGEQELMLRFKQAALAPALRLPLLPRFLTRVLY